MFLQNEHATWEYLEPKGRICQKWHMTTTFHPISALSPIHWNWVTLNGPDAKDFLQRLTTANLKIMQVGQGSPACFLTAQGKIRSYFTLWNYGAGEYAFEFDSGASDHGKSDLFQIIEQFTFAEKFDLIDVTSKLDCRWIFLDDNQPENTAIGQIRPGETRAIDEEIRICHHGNHSFGRTWITVWGRPARLNQWMDHFFSDAKPVDFLEIEKWRIENLSPWIDRELTPEVMPLEIGLRNSVAENKGCYPGQEVIEKIISLGAPPKRLIQISGEGTPPEAGEKILNLADSPTEVGQVTSVSFADNRYLALGIVRKIHSKEGLQVQFREKTCSIGVITKVAN